MAMLSLSVGYAVAGPPRHVDPAVIGGEPPSGLPLMLRLGLILHCISVEDFNLAKLYLNQSYMIYMPENMAYTFRRFLNLTYELSSEVNVTKSLVDRASFMAKFGNLEELLRSIGLAKRMILKSNITLSLVEGLGIDLATLLKTSHLPITENVTKIRELLKKYGATLEELTRSMGRTGPLRTKLTLSFNETEAWVGSYVSIIGELTDENDLPLADRTVLIYQLETEETLKVTTDDYGRFERAYRIPYVYRNITFFASFLPSEDEPYAPSFADATLKILYLHPKIQLNYTGEAKPGLSLTFYGLIKADSLPAEGIAVKLTWLGRSLSLLTDDKGRFTTNFTIPEDVSERLKLKVFTLPKEMIGPGYYETMMIIARDPSELEVRVPGLALTGLPLSLEGRFSTDDRPVEGARVYITFLDKVYEAVTDEEGRFKSSMTVPPLSFTGTYGLEVRAKPSEPWVEAGSFKTEIFVVNPILIIAPLAILALSIRELTRRRGKPALEPITKPAMAPEPEVEKEEGEEIPFYRQAIGLVSGVTGIGPLPSETLREFRRRAGRLLRERGLAAADETFARLIQLAERKLYGKSFTEDALANSLLNRLREELEA